MRVFQAEQDKEFALRAKQDSDAVIKLETDKIQKVQRKEGQAQKAEIASEEQAEVTSTLTHSESTTH